MRLTERDYLILNEVERWRFCLGRHIKLLADFSGERACDRRLKALIDAEYLSRKKILYGVPSVYSLTHKGKSLIGVNVRPDKFRIEQITHDIAVLDSAIYFISKFNISLSDILTEKQLHSRDGFSNRKHCPDFVFSQDGGPSPVEVELSTKSKVRFTKIVEAAYLEYQKQYWVVPENRFSILDRLQTLSNTYSGIEVVFLEEVQSYVKSNR